MPLPKRRHSSTRRDKRRANCKLKEILFVKDKSTGKICRPHRAYWDNGKLFYRGNLVFKREKV